ncbi:MAG: CBS domain-containing protein [Streptococcaceae bacterium]|jgi:acetoin utilization protein AcuB|nr:CBS domain-containing protein [Streptococcaceae bacterium]
MSVKDFMTKKVIYVSPETKIAKASELMKAHQIHRLPVIEHDRLVGLLTEGTIKDATPSKATSLSIYEMNYLLNKTTVKDVMIKHVITVSRFAMLEEAIALMRQHNIGVLPVVDDEQIVGIITDKDIFDAFLAISGYGLPGVRLTLALQTDAAGELAEVAAILARHNLSVNTIIINRREGLTLEIQIKTASIAEVQEIFDGSKFKILCLSAK